MQDYVLRVDQKWMLENSFASTVYQKKRVLKMEKRQKSHDKHKVFKEYLFEKRQDRKNYKVTRKTITADGRKSMFSGNCKTVDGSVPIEVGSLQRVTRTSKRV